MIKEADNLVDLGPRFKILAEAKNQNIIGPRQKTKIKFQGRAENQNNKGSKQNEVFVHIIRFGPGNNL